ncbi:receptor-type tyrosine-protein phosphatase U-like [Ostrea edulis]|uniref:receptor-type tyrosine-protein phosphatase U-like n=1 Tax=Ostrea edulis TaxID=37623 RepID=UPI0024AF0065|nr:receptor-type tyrosine-protein phosphatase U-like [Ostrea edulis]
MKNKNQSPNKRTVLQFHYNAWPDHGTPEELGLVQFHRSVIKKSQSESCFLVHCSAGVGRTGTYIGLDSLLRQGQDKGEMDVFEFVKQMREDRMTMVQTPEQYVFLHKALLCEYQGKGTTTSEADFPGKANKLLKDDSPLNQQELYEEFKSLSTLKPSYGDSDKEEATLPENKSKNVSMSILPVSKYRPYLTSHVKGRNDYINAVILPVLS